MGKAGRTQAGGRVIFEICVMQGGMKRAAHARGRQATAFRHKHGALFMFDISARITPAAAVCQRTLFSMLYIASFVITAVLPLHCQPSVRHGPPAPVVCTSIFARAGRRLCASSFLYF